MGSLCRKVAKTPGDTRPTAHPLSCLGSLRSCRTVPLLRPPLVAPLPVRPRSESDLPGSRRCLRRPSYLPNCAVLLGPGVLVFPSVRPLVHVGPLPLPGPRPSSRGESHIKFPSVLSRMTDTPRRSFLWSLLRPRRPPLGTDTRVEGFLVDWSSDLDGGGREARQRRHRFPSTRSTCVFLLRFGTTSRSGLSPYTEGRVALVPVLGGCRPGRP